MVNTNASLERVVCLCVQNGIQFSNYLQKFIKIIDKAMGGLIELLSAP